MEVNRQVIGREWRTRSHGRMCAIRLRRRPDEDCLQASEFIYESPYVPLSPELAAYAREDFGANRPLIDVVLDLSHRIHEEFKYQPLSTSIDFPSPKFCETVVACVRTLRTS